MKTEGEGPILEETGDSVTVLYRGRHLYSSRHPQNAPRRLATETPILPESLVFIPSYGLGYGIDELLERLPAGCHVLCVEHDRALMRLAQERNIVTWTGEPRLTVIQADDLTAVEEAFSRITAGGMFRRVTRLNLCGGAYLHPVFYNNVESYLARSIQSYWQNKMTVLHHGLLYVKNLYANVALLPRSYDAGGLFIERPLVVVGAGPSLPRSLPLVRALVTRCALLAVDTAVPVLLGLGIIPDFVISLEPQFINIRDFLPLGGRAVPLIADVSSSPQVVRLHLKTGNCPVYFFSSVFHRLALFDRLRAAGLLPLSIPPLGSVGVAAVYAALRFTSGPVFIAGLDFSYPFGRTHACGAPGDEHERCSHDRLRSLGQREFEFFCQRPTVLLASKDGGRVKSDLILSSYAQNLSVLVRREGRIYDLNPFGLPLGAPVVRTIDEASALLESGKADRAADVVRTAVRPTAWRPEAVCGFLKQEAAIVRDMNAVFEKKTEPGAPDMGTLDEEEWETVRRADQAWFYLPEKTPLPAYSKASAAHALIAGRYLAARIERARSAAT